MDPEQTLRQIRDRVAQILKDDDADWDAEVLAGHVQALDDWLSNGGFKPLDWS